VSGPPAERLSQEKAALRQHLQAWRTALTRQQVTQWSAALEAHLLQWPPLRAPRAVLLYAALRREPQTAGVAAALRRRGVVVAVPEVVGLDLVPHLLGAIAGSPPRPRDIDVVLVPGLGFDYRGGRLGRGGGHYDRFLPQLRQDCLRIGVCFAGQIVPAVPLEAWDQLVDAVATEAGVWEGVDRRGGRG